MKIPLSFTRLNSLLCTAMLFLGTQVQADEFQAGLPLGAVNEAGAWVPMSENVKVFGSFNFAESCVFDAKRNLILVVNSGDRQDKARNDGYVSLIHPDGTVHTPKWIGATRNGLELYNPLGSAIQNDELYIVDTDTVRIFELNTGKPLRSYPVAGSTFLNGIAVSDDGTMYISNTRPSSTVFKVEKDGSSSIFIQGGSLKDPNGVAIDHDGNIVVVNIGNRDVLTYSPEGELIKTEKAAEKGSDGVVILKDGAKYISSVRHGIISGIKEGENVATVATGIPHAASMCYDSIQHQLVIPMNPNNALAFVKL